MAGAPPFSTQRHFRTMEKIDLFKLETIRSPAPLVLPPASNAVSSAASSASGAVRRLQPLPAPPQPRRQATNYIRYLCSAVPTLVELLFHRRPAVVQFELRV
jgi:hypothetical protein